ncbi:inositol monophosphatase family protein [Pseudaeromonas paramecii]|uniref:Inositol-1-monophosphatase n=1 Tax=Pseudaeromonas paramecii TaxID=2138166 RepID=A0ABP8PYB7_9GAMM
MSQTLSPALAARYQTAQRLIREAGALARRAFLSPQADDIAFKGPQDFLTQTDLAVERLLRQRLQAAFPADSLLGEEQGGHPGDATWVLDPIDGTANFARGIPHFCCVLAFVSGGQTRLGLIYDPLHDELFHAAQGQGAWLNDQPLRVAGTREFAQANLELGWNTRVPNQHYLSTLGGLLGLGANVRRGASGALALAYVAAGRTDGYLELHMHPWDCLAGLLLVREAGGLTRDPVEQADWAAGGPVLAAVPPFAAALAHQAGLPSPSAPRSPA